MISIDYRGFYYSARSSPHVQSDDIMHNEMLILFLLLFFVLSKELRFYFPGKIKYWDVNMLFLCLKTIQSGRMDD